MPRSGKGGRRQGTPGKAYSQRSDLNERRPLPAQAAPGQTYGKAKAQIDSQKQIPLAPGPAVPSPAGPGAPAQGPLPGSLGNLLAPTARPNEPLTAGAPVGPGPGPGMPNADTDPVLIQLQAMYLRFPTEHLRRLIQDYD